MKRHIGFSHGVLHRILEIYSKEALELYQKCSSEVLEVCINKMEDLPKLGTIIPFAQGFTRKSIHLPVHFTYRSDEKTKQLLDEIASFSRQIQAELLLVHPDLVEDWSVFDLYNENWAIENMDNRKECYKTPEELQTFFEQRPHWKFVLDVNHCFSNDETMKIAKQFLASCGDHLAEIHLSGYTEYHEPLFQTQQESILNVCKPLNVPIVIESTFDQVDDLKREYDYISSRLNG
jgi:hypothetical protein